MAALTVLLVAGAACSGGGGGGGGPNPGPAGEPPGNQPPVAATFAISGRANAARTFDLQGSDPDGNPLTFRITSGPYHGTVALSGRTVTFTPQADFQGDDLLLYQVNDGWKDATYAGAVYVTVNEATFNTPPAAADQDLWTPPATALAFAVPVSDADGDPLAITVRDAPRHGALSGTGAQRTYTPAPGFVGTDVIGFDADDGTTTASARVAISVGVRPTFSPMTEDARTAAMDAMTALRAQIDPATDASIEQLEGAIRALPGVAYAGRNATGVWGQFQDGAAFLVGTYVPPGPVDPLPVDSTAPAAPAKAFTAGVAAPSLPAGQRAIILNALPLTAHFGPNKGAEIKPLLEAAGYTVASVLDAARVSDFANVKNYGAVYVRSHGGSGQAWDPTTGTTSLGVIPSIWTATPADPTMRAAYDLDIKAQKITYMNQVVDANVLSKTSEWHLGLSPLFIRANWQLSGRGYVHLSACWLGNPYGQATATSGLAPGLLHNALFARGAAFVAGWSRSTLVGVMDKAAAFAFDRMTGANLAEPKEDPPQRPMAAKTTLADMYRRDLATSYLDDTYLSEFRFVLPANGIPTIDRLAPSITYLQPDPARMKLQVYGDLGTLGVPIANLKVTIDGVDYPVTYDGPDYVECELPSNASGDVTVTVDGKKSNRVRLGRWNGTLKYEITGPGSLSQVYTYTVKVVGDVHEFRTQAGKPPEPRKSFYVPMLAQGSSGTYTASGLNADASHKVTWSGGGAITPHVDTTSCDGCFTFMGNMFPESRGYLWWDIFTGIHNAYDQQLYSWNGTQWTSAGGGSQPVIFPFFTGMDYDGPLPADMFALKTPALVGPDGTIAGVQIGPEDMPPNGITNFAGWTLQHKVSWATMTPVPGSEIDAQMPR